MPSPWRGGGLATSQKNVARYGPNGDNLMSTEKKLSSKNAQSKNHQIHREYS